MVREAGVIRLLWRTALSQSVAAQRRSSSRTPAATTAIRSGLATAPPAEGGTAGGEGGEEDEEALGEAAAKRAALLKRYGDRTPPSGPIAVKVDPAKAETGNSSRGFDVEKAAAGEVNHNEIWGDYVRYMEHQRKKGWKT
ncbi:expressed unknown protein [Ectocarpus siliculosus]|uniref:Uncharacterized protein n=1 Tax=Ectocarpus siliculosus TaxID=2880 RepID=D8LSF9_ECTSI|nr:expressed unknown protein [Ectocarpus siliculosus]|eukprot:CBN75216.1 expressed unknown protein [Ectocarpus siliculosus]